MCAYSNLVSSPGLLHRIQQHEKGWGTWLDCIVSMHIQGYPAMMSSWLKAHRFSAPSCTESHWFLGPLHPAPASPLGQGSPSGGGRLSGGGKAAKGGTTSETPSVVVGCPSNRAFLSQGKSNKQTHTHTHTHTAHFTHTHTFVLGQVSHWLLKFRTGWECTMH